VDAKPIEKAFGDPVVARGVAFGIFPRGNLRHVYNGFEPRPPCRVREIRRCRKEADYQTRYSYFPATPKPIISADVRSVRNSRETPRHVKVFGFLYDIETTAIGRSQPMTALRQKRSYNRLPGYEIVARFRYAVLLTIKIALKIMGFYRPSTSHW
jgi:hypothetical protein